MLSLSFAEALLSVSASLLKDCAFSPALKPEPQSEDEGDRADDARSSDKAARESVLDHQSLRLQRAALAALAAVSMAFNVAAGLAFRPGC